MSTPSAVCTYAANGGGGRHQSCTIDGVRVLVECTDAANQDKADEVARRVASVPTLEHGLRVARQQRDNARERVAQLDGSRRTPSLLGEAVVRERIGGVWLLSNAEKGWAAFGYRFDSWAQLAAERPEIRPCGVGVDEQGPFVRVRCIAAA